MKENRFEKYQLVLVGWFSMYENYNNFLMRLYNDSGLSSKVVWKYLTVKGDEIFDKSSICTNF